MGDPTVDSSNLARKVMKIDGNPRVNLLRGSSKGNEASKTNSSSRYPVKGTAVESKMMINPKATDRMADASVATIRSHLEQTQRLIDNDPLDQQLLDREAELLASFKVASLDEERFLKQKAKVHWLAEGDANTKFFHNTLKCRNHRARIDVITDTNGILHEGKEVPKAFVDHYVGFLGKEEAVIMPITQELFDVRIDQAMPKTEGGLGIKRIRDMNKALMSFHIWSIISKRPSVWVDWIQHYRLKGRNIWSVEVPRLFLGLEKDSAAPSYYS
ncbi:hypothetical protein QVD17_00064 [Tagetes erecta]|uniref:RNA-directed DNA polymerase, eukaryota, reverse transcriptase zinc-binding domain protein n=1 Tax=Tagetes erecta TaxID=13708 RepID=A0AAD8P722_TARER|nr:hypothetical protein QVD17_00064 [Tagetes erecta]